MNVHILNRQSRPVWWNGKKNYKISPLNLAVTRGNGHKKFYRESTCSKLIITLDRHNARLKLNYWLLSDTLNFSLLSTFKLGWNRGFVHDPCTQLLNIVFITSPSFHGLKNKRDRHWPPAKLRWERQGPDIYNLNIFSLFGNHHNGLTSLTYFS